MAFTKITQEDIADKGVVGLADTPNLSTQAMQEKFDELALDVLMPKHNSLIDELEAKEAAGNIGAVDALGEATTVQAMIDRAVQSGYTKAETDALLSNKVDREQGKGLTTNDFSDAYKYKLNNIEDNANNYVLPKATSSSLGGVMPDNTTFTVDENGVGHAIGGGGGGTADYEALVNKPIINGVTVMGDKTSEEYGLLRPYIVVTSDAGSTVSISKGGVTIQAEQITSTTWGVYPTSYGSWTVKSSLAGADDSTATVVVDTVKTYAISVNHISATITVTYPSGASCVLSKGAIEYVATSSPQTFTVQSIGTWTVTTTLDGVVKTATVSITADGQSQSVTVEYVEIEVTYGNDFEGKTITCTDGVDTYTKTASGGKVSFFIPAYGSTWTISGEVSGTPYSTQQTVTEFTKYTVVLNVFSATVTVTFPYSKGATCTLSDGNTTLTATTSPMAFNVGNTGTWVATVTLDNIVKSDSVSITTDGQTEALTIEYGEIELIFDNEFRGLSVICNSGVTNIIKTAPISGNTMYFYPPSTGEWAISSTYSGNSYSTSATVTSLSVQASAILRLRPNGATATPTDDIQTWLQCGGIFDKSYTTLSEVLADSTTLSTLINDHNAVDYMKRSKTWCGVGLVPKMTSATTPSGEVIAQDYCTRLNMYPYYAFDGDESGDMSWGNEENSTTSSWIGYRFDKPQVVTRVKIIGAVARINTSGTAVLQASNDDFATYDTLATSSPLALTSTPQNFDVNVTNSTPYRSYRIANIVHTSGAYSFIKEIQFYGENICDNSTAMSYVGLNNYASNTLTADADWNDAIQNSAYFESVDNAKIPNMTSNTTPSGVCSGSSVYNASYDYYKPFDGTNSSATDCWHSQSGTSAWLQYQSASPFAVKKMSVRNINGGAVGYDYTFTLKGSNDGSTFTDLVCSGNSWTATSNTLHEFVVTNSTAYSYYRLVVNTQTSNPYVIIGQLQLYGRVDV